MNTAAAFDAASVKITRKRFSVTQGEVLVEYAGVRIEQYGDKIEMRGDGTFAGLDDAAWIAVARREAIARGLASEPAPVKLVRLTKSGAPSRISGAVERYPDRESAALEVAYRRKVNLGRPLRYALNGVEI